MWGGGVLPVPADDFVTGLFLGGTRLSGWVLAFDDFWGEKRVERTSEPWGFMLTMFSHLGAGVGVTPMQ